VTYYEFIDFNQAGLAVIDYNNTREYNLVVIKRLKEVNKNLVYKIQPFINDYIISIKDMYFNNNDLVIIYKLIDIFLHTITSIL
jgi:hypothetical protein